MNFLEKLDTGIKSHRGLLREIAKESGKTERWLRLVLNGTRTDSELVLLASKMFVEREEKVKALMEQAEALVNSIKDKGTVFSENA